MVIDPEERPTEFKIVVEPQVKRPPLGFLLTLLAIGLVLAPAQAVKELTQFGQTQPTGPLATVLSVGSLIRAGWAIVNLVLLVKRSRRFPRMMIALVGYSLMLSIVDVGTLLPNVGPSEKWPLLGGLGLAIVIGGLWVAYLLKSRHVRDVFVR